MKTVDLIAIFIVVVLTGACVGHSVSIQLSPELTKPDSTLAAIDARTRIPPETEDVYYVFENGEIEVLAQKFNDEWGNAYETGVYDCSDMALQLYWWYWKSGYKTRLVIGNLERDEKSLSECNHAWVLVWDDSNVENAGWVAVESTNGDVFYADMQYERMDGSVINGSEYYTGYIFSDPDEYLKALYE